MYVTTLDGVALWWAIEGSGPAVLLVPGRGDPTDLFPQQFSDSLVASGLSVLRWDLRDTGLSGPGGDEYTVATMAEDGVALLDAAGVGRVHLVGISMAGLVMTHLATSFPERVRSLTYISAMSPDPGAGMGDDFFGALDLDPEDRVGALLRAMGDVSDSDRCWAEKTIAAGDRRAPHRPDAISKHQEAAFRLDWPTMESLRSIDVPTHVFHGALDRVLPIAHAEALGTGIAGASVTIIDGMGHIPRPADWGRIADALTANLA